jgi:HEAT repeat protein
MTIDIDQLLRQVQIGTRDQVWEAARELESVVVEMVQALIDVLNTGKTADSRAGAAYVLGFGRFASGRIPLEGVLANRDEGSFVRGHAAEALAYIKSRESVDVLLRHLEDDDRAVQYWCIFALGQIGDSRVLPILARLVDRVGDQMYERHLLRDEIVNAIAAINHQAVDGDRRMDP